jgi:hypothetical protein
MANGEWNSCRGGTGAMIVFGAAVAAAWRKRAAHEGLVWHIASYGGSGTVFLCQWLMWRRKMRVVTPAWHALLNHYAVPLELGLPRLCLLADPATAYASVVRRNLAEGVSRNLHGGQYGRDLVEGMEHFFTHWTAASPLIFVKYEALYDHLGDLGSILGVKMDGFPPRRERQTAPVECDDERLLRLRAHWAQLPEMMVR